MSERKDQSFDVFFEGECLPGHDPAVVRQAVGALFKADDSTLERLFSGARQPIKRGCDKATALNYQRAMSKVGAKPVILRRRDEQAAAGLPEDQASGKSAPSRDSGNEDQLTLAPPGADVLAESERRSVPPLDINTDHLAAEPIGDRLAPPAPEVPPLPVPDFELAEVGEDLLEAGPDEPVDAPTGELFSLAPENHDLSDCAIESVATQEPATEHLDIAAPGEDLLTEEQRRSETPPAPDTSHLRVEDAGDGA